MQSQTNRRLSEAASDQGLHFLSQPFTLGLRLLYAKKRPYIFVLHFVTAFLLKLVGNGINKFGGERVKGSEWVKVQRTFDSLIAAILCHC